MAPEFPIVVELGGAPRGKGRPRSVRLANGGIGHHTDALTREYEANLKLQAQAVMAGRAPLAGPLRVLVEAFFPLPASKSLKWKRAALAGIERPTIKPDLDNICKNLDAANGVLFNDDRQIVEAIIVKRYSDRPRLRISVVPLGRAARRAEDLFAAQ